MNATKAAITTVRGYLKNIPTDGDESSQDTWKKLSKEWSVGVRNLKQFSEGNNQAIPKPIVQQWAKLIGNDGIISAGQSPIINDWNMRLSEEPVDRNARYELYEKMDDNRPEACSALDAWADICVTGSIGNMDAAGSGFDAEYLGNNALIRDLVKQNNLLINKKLLPDEEKIKLSRDMAKFGQQFEQILVSKNNNELGISSLVNMPVKTMFYNRLEDGTFDPEKVYYQKLLTDREPRAFFPIWRIASFANRRTRSSPEGYSVFHSGRRAYVEIDAMEGSMIIRRIDRAPLRYKKTIDVGLCQTNDEIETYMNTIKRMDRKVSTITKDGVVGAQKINRPPDEDIFVAKRGADSPADVEVLQGDAHLSEIEDFNHFFAKWLAVLGPPKTHLGYEMGTQRSIVTEQHIVWARRGRRFQMHFMAGLRQLHWVNMLLKGVDPRSVDFVIWPPTMGTKDELLRAQVMNLLAQVADTLSAAMSMGGEVPDVNWLLKHVMMMPEEAIEELELRPALQSREPRGTGNKSNGSGGGISKKEKQEEMAIVAINNDEIAKKAVIVEALIQERAVAMRKKNWMRKEDRDIIYGQALPYLCLGGDDWIGQIGKK